MGKKVMSLLQNDGGVMIRCSDNSTVQGDILVGADGTYSGVRQHLYKTLKDKKLLPASDEKAMPFSCICLVGQTEVLDPEEFPGLKQHHSQWVFVVGDEDYSVTDLLSKRQHSSLVCGSLFVVPDINIVAIFLFC